jgi:hypothetical protein
VQVGTFGPFEPDDCLEIRAEAETDEAARPRIRMLLENCIVMRFEAMEDERSAKR